MACSTVEILSSLFVDQNVIYCKKKHDELPDLPIKSSQPVRDVLCIKQLFF